MAPVDSRLRSPHLPVGRLAVYLKACRLSPRPSRRPAGRSRRSKNFDDVSQAAHVCNEIFKSMKTAGSRLSELKGDLTNAMNAPYPSEDEIDYLEYEVIRQEEIYKKWVRVWKRHACKFTLFAAERLV